MLDFGISKVQGTADKSLTRTSALLGSPGYMSPEQVRSSKHVDPRSDIWSVGVILYRLLADTPPFDGVAVGAVFAAILEQAPADIRTIRAEVPEGLADVIAKCLTRDRDARWQNAAELANALVPYASDDGVRSVSRISKSPRFTSSPPPPLTQATPAPAPAPIAAAPRPPPAAEAAPPSAPPATARDAAPVSSFVPSPPPLTTTKIGPVIIVGAILALAAIATTLIVLGR